MSYDVFVQGLRAGEPVAADLPPALRDEVAVLTSGADLSRAIGNAAAD